MQYILQKIAIALAIPVISVLNFAGLNVQPKLAPVTPIVQSVSQGTLGAANTIETPVALFQTSLATAITSSASSMTLASGLTKDGTTLASSTYSFIIDEGTAIQEFVKADCTNTTCINMTRGLSVISGTTTIPTLQQAHRRGATIKITDAPLLLRITNILNGGETLSNPIQYSSNLSTTTLALNRANIASVGLLQDTAFAGAGVINASTAAKGTVQIPTNVQVASSTAVGSSGAILAIPTTMSTSTAGTANHLVPVTKIDGTLDQGFLPSTISKAVTFSGAITFSSTTAGVTTKFGGTGADGALTITSGTTTIDLGGLAVVTKNYSSISITGTGSLQFSNPHANGSLIVLKSTGNVTLTSSVNAIEATSTGATAGTGSCCGGAGNGGNPAYGVFHNVPAGGAGGGTNGGSGAGGTPGTSPLNAYRFIGNNIMLAPGGGGGGGGSTGGSGGSAGGGAGGSSLINVGITGSSGGGTTGVNATGSSGGRGGGAIYIECNGTLNFTSTVSVQGQKGFNGAVGGGAGGGGGGGTFIMLYNGTPTANSGTITVTGGAGGTDNAGGNGGVGFGTSTKNVIF